MGRGAMVRLFLFLAAVALAVATQEVHPLEGGEAEKLGEVALVETLSRKSKVWSKTGKVPPNTTFYKTLKGFEHHGKCRFSCYQEKVCGGYSWVPATHTCKLFSAPNFLVSPFSNDQWHKVASKTTGQKYKKDQSTGKAAKKLGKLKKAAGKKTKPLHPRTKTIGGHVHLGLDKIANAALKRDAKKSNKKGKIGLKLKVVKSKLYAEFVDKYKHEYTKRAENVIKKRAHKIADARIKKMNKKHPKAKATKKDRLKYYKQAKKEVEGHAVRQAQRKFKKRLKAWTNGKVFDDKESLLKAKRQKKAKKSKAKGKKKKKMKKKMKPKTPIKGGVKAANKKAKKAAKKKKKKAKKKAKAKKAKKKAAKKAKKAGKKAAKKD